MTYLFRVPDTGKEEKRAIHVIIRQKTIRPEHDIYAKGLDQVRDVILEKWMQSFVVDLRRLRLPYVKLMGQELN